MVDSGTNAVILPLRPDMCGEIAEYKVPSATVERPIVQVLKYGQERHLVVALPQSAVLISQEWLATVAGWTFIAAPKDGVSEILVYTSTRGDPKTLANEMDYPTRLKNCFWKPWKTSQLKPL